MRRETETFFAQIVRENKSVLDLYTANYTYLNESLARHYGIAGVTGPEFRRVQYTDDKRAGILGHASVLTLTSVANRTSPVLRGKWVMEVLLGSPPPPAPRGPRPRRDQGREGRAHAHDARADGDAPRERRLPFVPPVHGPDRAGAGQLRRHGALAHS
jgi:hypothetical protein